MKKEELKLTNGIKGWEIIRTISYRVGVSIELKQAEKLLEKMENKEQLHIQPVIIRINK